MTGCQVNGCTNTPNIEVVYDCGDSEQRAVLCMQHYESYDIMADGTKFYYFKKFAKSVEVLTQ